jgi:hypothetical protein
MLHSSAGKWVAISQASGCESEFHVNLVSNALLDLPLFVRFRPDSIVVMIE